MKTIWKLCGKALPALCLSGLAWAQAPNPASAPAAPAANLAAPAASKFDAALAKAVGADEMGMRKYVLVILKTGPNKIPAGSERNEMFKGHFANINRLAAEGRLAVAGPFGAGAGSDWRGLFILAVEDIEEARKLVATDPVIIKGEMVAEYHKWYGSAALMLTTEAHHRVAAKSF